MIRRPGIQLGAFPFQPHGFRSRVQRDIPDPGIIQTERHKHRRPVAVGIAVPLAIAGNAPPHAVLIHLEVFLAFRHAQLGACHRQDILCIAGASDQFRQGVFPHIGSLQIGRQVTVAAGRMDMLLQGAFFQNPVTAVRMAVSFRLLQSAEVAALV